MRSTYKAMVREIMRHGYNVWVSFSGTSKSRSIEFFVWRHRIRIRLADHASKKAWEYNYDVYVERPRIGALSYCEWKADLENMIKAIREQEKALRGSIFFNL